MKRYQKDGYHAEHGEGVFALYEDARREIDELKTRLAEAEVQKCTSPFSDSPPCRGIQKCLDRIAEAEEELATVKKIAMQIVQVCYYAGAEGDLSDRINNQMLLVLKEALAKLEELQEENKW